MLGTSASSKGGGGLVIGNPVINGGVDQVLYIDSSGNLASDGGLTWDGNSFNATNMQTDYLFSFDGLSVTSGQTLLDGGAIQTSGGGAMTVYSLLCNGPLSVNGTSQFDGGQASTDGGGGFNMNQLTANGTISFDANNAYSNGSGGLAVQQILDPNSGGAVLDVVNYQVSGSSTAVVWDINGGVFNNASASNVLYLNSAGGIGLPLGVGTYKSFTTVLNGLPAIVFNPNAQTLGAAVSTTTIVTNTSTSPALYEVSAYHYCNSAGVSGTSVLSFTFFDGTASVTVTCPTLSMGALGGVSQPATPILLGPGFVTPRSLTFAMTYTVGTGSPRVSYTIIVKKIS